MKFVHLIRLPASERRGKILPSAASGLKQKHYHELVANEKVIT
jgi:hypothetical protein